MTTAYTLRIPVRAWRVAEDGSLPEEARAMMGSASVTSVQHIVGDYTDEQMATYARRQEAIPSWPIPDRHYDYWQWYDLYRSETCKARPGDWIVASEYGVEAMSDEEFRACCEEVDGTD